MARNLKPSELKSSQLETRKIKKACNWKTAEFRNWKPAELKDLQMKTLTLSYLSICEII